MSLLTDEQKERIKEEEEIKEEVRKPKVTGFGKKFIQFLNTPFALFLLTSIVLAGFTTLFTHYQAKWKKDAENLDIAVKLDDEIDNRIRIAECKLKKFESDIDKPPSNPDEITLPDNISDPKFINIYIVDRLNGEPLQNGEEAKIIKPIYAENKDKPFYSLVSDLKNAVPDDKKTNLKTVLDKFRDLRKSIETADGFFAQRENAKNSGQKAKDYKEKFSDEYNKMIAIERAEIQRINGVLTEIRNLRWQITDLKCD